MACQPGRFSLAGATNCTTCPAGYSCETPTLKAACPVGKWSLSGYTVCIPVHRMRVVLNWTLLVMLDRVVVPRWVPVCDHKRNAGSMHTWQVQHWCEIVSEAIIWVSLAQCWFCRQPDLVHVLSSRVCGEFNVTCVRSTTTTPDVSWGSVLKSIRASYSPVNPGSTRRAVSPLALPARRVRTRLSGSCDVGHQRLWLFRELLSFDHSGHCGRLPCWIVVRHLEFAVFAVSSWVSAWAADLGG